MPPNQDDEAMSQIGVYIPTNVKESLFLLAHHRTDPRDSTTVSQLAREYIQEGLCQEDDLPNDVLALMSEDMLSDFFDGEIPSGTELSEEVSKS